MAFMNWVDLLGNLKRSSARRGGINPKMLEVYRGVAPAQSSNGVLDAKMRELIAMAEAVTTRCDGCISSHAAAASRVRLRRG